MVYSYTRHQEDALDIVQNAVCKALEAHESIKNEDAVKTWFYRLLINECLTVLKKRKRVLLTADEPGQMEVYYEKGYEPNDDLEKELDRLEPDVQEIIKLRFFEELSLKEISCITGFNLNTVKTKLYRGLKQLKVNMQEIQRSRRQQEEKEKAAGSRRRFRRRIHGMAAAAAICILFTAALNVSPVFAKEAGELPVIGGLARVLTFRSYETEKNDIAVSVEIPTIDTIAEDTGVTVEGINQEILACCDQYADEAVRRAEEYRTAFLETGGTEEEWAEHNIRITVGYEIRRQSGNYLSFVVRGTESWTTACGESRYYNLNLNTGERVTLKSMLGSDYVELVNRSIREQIAERESMGETFFTAQEGGFTGISEDVKFYINENDRPVIVFEKYEIAPGSSGEIEFEIRQDTTADIPQEIGYEDNFAVDREAAEAFAQRVKDAAAGKDLETLAQLTAFPVYVGLPDVGMVETKDDFLKLGAEAVFTDELELLKSVEAADINGFQPSMAGFSISDGGTANINFGVVDGVLAVSGINY